MTKIPTNQNEISETTHYLKNLIEKCSIDEKENIFHIYDKVKNKSSNLNKAKRKRLAAAIIFYWIKKNKSDISLKIFAKEICLSQFFIKKNLRK